MSEQLTPVQYQEATARYIDYGQGCIFGEIDFMLLNAYQFGFMKNQSI